MSVIVPTPSISVSRSSSPSAIECRPRDPPGLAQLGLVVVGRVLEEQRHDPLRDQVAPVDAREALRDHGADAELGGRERRVLAARALAVVVAGDDEPSAPLVRAPRELLVAVLEGELRDRGDIRAVGHHGRAVGREVAGRDVVRGDDQDAQLQLVRKRLLLGRRLDVRPARDLDRAPPPRPGRARGCGSARPRDGPRAARAARRRRAPAGRRSRRSASTRRRRPASRGRPGRRRCRCGPGKLRLKVRSELEPDGGAWPMPTHGPQAGSSMRTPAIRRST